MSGQTLAPARDVPLAPLTTLGVGGPARFYVRADGPDAVSEALAWARREGQAVFVLGGGSNLVVADRGFPGLVLHLSPAEGGEPVAARAEADGPVLDVAAATPWDDVVAFAVARGWAGLECLSGIPGQAGATPIQNVGAYGQEVSDTLVDVELAARDSGERETWAAAACELAYRDSVFKGRLRDRFVVLRARFRLRAEDRCAVRYAELERALGKNEAPLAEVRAKVIELRRGKSMVLDPADENGRSAGSFFMNPIVSVERAAEAERRARRSGTLAPSEKMPRWPTPDGRVKLAAGWLIERSGFWKGFAAGPVGLSTKHALAIVNRGGASAGQVLGFAAAIRGGVKQRLGVTLAMEPELVGFDEAERIRIGS